jgi:A/G-specific adenine glycosylase
MEIRDSVAERFRERLLEWHHLQNNRSLPWKGIKNPYNIWLSEVILQQTRALQGLPYYTKFIEKWPDVHALALAKDEEVFRAWQGLGYYNRCKNMLATARFIVDIYNGIFPDTYQQILSLKGIGAYTASAIASFAYGLPHAVVDGNVYRVLSRYLGVSESVDTTKGKKLFANLAQQMLYTHDSAAYNQAIMDLGATICTPARPNCTSCPHQMSCYAHIKNVTDSFPVRTKKLTIRNRYFGYVVLQHENQIWLRKRAGGDIWENLFEPYLIEYDKPIAAEDLPSLLTQQLHIANTTAIEYLHSEKQRLTHQLIHFSFFRVLLEEKLTLNDGNWVDKSIIEKIPFPKTVISFFRKNLYF